MPSSLENKKNKSKLPNVSALVHFLLKVIIRDNMEEEEEDSFVFNDMEFVSVHLNMERVGACNDRNSRKSVV